MSPRRRTPWICPRCARRSRVAPGDPCGTCGLERPEPPTSTAAGLRGAALLSALLGTACAGGSAHATLDADAPAPRAPDTPDEQDTPADIARLDTATAPLGEGPATPHDEAPLPPPTEPTQSEPPQAQPAQAQPPQAQPPQAQPPQAQPAPAAPAQTTPEPQRRTTQPSDDPRARPEPRPMPEYGGPPLRPTGGSDGWTVQITEVSAQSEEGTAIHVTDRMRQGADGTIRWIERELASAAERHDARGEGVLQARIRVATGRAQRAEFVLQGYENQTFTAEAQHQLSRRAAAFRFPDSEEPYILLVRMRVRSDGSGGAIPLY